MPGRPFFIFGRVVNFLISMAVISALTGCAPKISPSMSPEDLQTCDDTAATIKENLSFPVSPYEAKYVPYMVTPGEAEITSPLYGSIIPYGEPVNISFTQPPPDPNVSFRILKVFVTPINTVNLSKLNIPMFSLSGKVPSTYPNFGINWTPGSSGKFIILVMFWNLKYGGNPEGFPRIDFGPPSLAYECVKIDVPKAGGAKTLQPVTMMPLENITLPPTITHTVTLFPTSTYTLTFTPTFTSTFTPFIPTFTSTFTPKPPTPVPPTPVRPTAIPPTTVVDCSAFTEQRPCESNNACKWVTPPSGGPGSCVNK